MNHGVLLEPMFWSDAEMLRQFAGINQALFTTKKFLMPPSGIDPGSSRLPAIRSTTELRPLHIKICYYAIYKLEATSRNLSGFHRLQAVNPNFPAYGGM